MAKDDVQEPILHTLKISMPITLVERSFKGTPTDIEYLFNSFRTTKPHAFSSLERYDEGGKEIEKIDLNKTRRFWDGGI